MNKFPLAIADMEAGHKSLVGGVGLHLPHHLLPADLYLRVGVRTKRGKLRIYNSRSSFGLEGEGQGSLLPYGQLVASCFKD
jgi:hypothetical protein